MMDVKGPEIRTGVVAEPIELEVGDTFEFYTDVAHRRRRAACSVNYPGLAGATSASAPPSWSTAA